ncbi:MAG: protein kinase [Lachnospiraceae bacterium]|nr:protein kinase [Lachnospiraceae bacterium]
MVYISQVAEEYFRDTYQFLHTIKQSEKSDIYLVLHIEENKKYILKKVSNGIEIYSKLKLMNLRYIPMVYDVIENDFGAWVIEEYIEGISLEELLTDVGKLSAKETKAYIIQLCSALNELHQQGIVHRDIKPSNILIMDNESIKLIDFDAARFVKENAQKDTKYLGTEGYAAPEQYGFGQTDFRTDIYALGVTMKEMLGEGTKNGYLDKIIGKCIRKDPEDRFSSVNQVKNALQRKGLKTQLIFAGLSVFILLGISFIFHNAYQTEEVVQQETLPLTDLNNKQPLTDGVGVLLTDEDMIKLYSDAMAKRNELYLWRDRADTPTMIYGEEYYVLSEKYNSWDKIKTFFSDTWSKMAIEGIISDLSNSGLVEKDGLLYTLDADGGCILQYENAEILKRTNNGANVEVVFSVPGGDYTPTRVKVEAVHEDDGWKIESYEDVLDYAVEDKDSYYDGYSYYNSTYQVGFYYPLRFFDYKYEQENGIELSSLDGNSMSFFIENKGEERSLEKYYLEYKKENMLVDEKDDNLFLISYIEDGLWNLVSVSEYGEGFLVLKMGAKEDYLKTYYPYFQEILNSMHEGEGKVLIEAGKGDFFDTKSISEYVALQDFNITIYYSTINSDEYYGLSYEEDGRYFIYNDGEKMEGFAGERYSVEAEGFPFKWKYPMDNAYNKEYFNGKYGEIPIY